MTADEPQRSFVSTADVDLKIYRNRWKALDTYIVGITGYYAQQEFPRKDTILYLLKSLRAFATGQFGFFYYGFSPSPDQVYPELSRHADYPVPDILTAVLDQIEYDIEVIQRAADQRILAKTNDTFSKTLENADKLAWGSMLPAIKSAAVAESTTVLTYFHKSASLYRIPYAQVALIALPYTATENLRDYLGAPHELGHAISKLVTKMAAAKKQELKKNILSQITSEYEDWLAVVFEEMFADIYGCLIGGPVIALSMQGICLEYGRDRFIKGDGKHPSPVLRTYISTQVLQHPKVKEKLGCDWAPVGAKLAEHWTQIIQVHEFSVDKSEEWISRD